MKATIICPSCGATTSTERGVCEYCGTPLPGFTVKAESQTNDQKDKKISPRKVISYIFLCLAGTVSFYLSVGVLYSLADEEIGFDIIIITLTISIATIILEAISYYIYRFKKVIYWSILSLTLLSEVIYLIGSALLFYGIFD